MLSHIPLPVAHHTLASYSSALTSLGAFVTALRPCLWASLLHRERKGPIVLVSTVT